MGKLMAWYDFRILYNQKVYRLVSFHHPLSTEYNLEVLTLYLSHACLERVSAAPDNILQILYVNSNDYRIKISIKFMCKDPKREVIFYLDRTDSLADLWDEGTVSIMSS